MSDLSDAPLIPEDLPAGYLNSFLVSTYWGQTISLVLLGLQIFMCVYGTFHFGASSPSARKQRLPYVCLSLTILSLTIVAITVDNYSAQLVLIDRGDGDAGILSALLNQPIALGTLSLVCNLVAAWIGEGLLIYRAYIIWQGKRWVIVIPVLIFLASIVISLLNLAQLILNEHFRIQLGVFAIAWMALSVGVNVVTTTLIIFKLMHMRSALSRVLSQEHLRVYTGVAALLIESALPLSIFGIISVITLATNKTAYGAFALIWNALTAVSPQFIIFRVALGRSWTKNLQQEATEKTPSRDFFTSQTDNSFLVGESFGA